MCRPARGSNVRLGPVVDHWESEAENWVRWARTRGHDAYWYYSPGFFDQIIPPPGRLTVEIGCGEGRVTRDLTGRGHRVLGVDVSPTLVRAARRAEPSGWYVVADAAQLPLPSGTADLVVAYNSLMDVDDMPGRGRRGWSGSGGGRSPVRASCIRSRTPVLGLMTAPPSPSRTTTCKGGASRRPLSGRVSSTAEK